MDFNRRGETLWHEWDGTGFTPTSVDNVIFCTHGHVNVAEDVVLRALASAVQRDGVSDTLGYAFTAIQPFTAVQGYSGDIDGGPEIAVCDENGETYYGDIVDAVIPTTWVEVETIVR